MAERKHADQLLQRFGARGTGAAEPDGAEGTFGDHQSSGQAFALSVAFKDGRRKQTFPWSMYGGHEWTDDGEMETIIALFGPRLLTVRGYRLAELDRQMSLGKRAGLRQHSSRQVELMLAEDGAEPIVVEVEANPPFPDLTKSMTEENP